MLANMHLVTFQYIFLPFLLHFLSIFHHDKLKEHVLIYDIFSLFNKLYAEDYNFF